MILKPDSYHDLHGEISAILSEQKRLDDFCVKFIHDYNPDRFEAFAIRLFTGKETVITIYALDKSFQENQTIHIGKLPVRKFKMNTLQVADLFSFFEEINFTIGTGNYDLENMLVINR